MDLVPHFWLFFFKKTLVVENLCDSTMVLTRSSTSSSTEIANQETDHPEVPEYTPQPFRPARRVSQLWPELGQHNHWIDESRRRSAQLSESFQRHLETPTNATGRVRQLLTTTRLPSRRLRFGRPDLGAGGDGENGTPSTSSSPVTNATAAAARAFKITQQLAEWRRSFTDSASMSPAARDPMDSEPEPGNQPTTEPVVPHAPTRGPPPPPPPSGPPPPPPPGGGDGGGGDDDSEGSNKDEDLPPPPQVAPDPNLPHYVTVDGRRLSVVQQEATTLVQSRLWDKEKRFKLRDDVRQHFQRSATSHILGKHVYLKKQSTQTDAHGILEQVQDLKTIISKLKAHMEQHDMIDVCSIMTPLTDFARSPLVKHQYNLFSDYAQLTPHMVGESNYFYNRYIQEPYIKDNMGLIFSFLQANTEEKFFRKCLEAYEEFDPFQQGGPLILILILQQIQDSSEAAIVRVRGSLETLKIKDLEGENVDTAVSMIKTVTELLTSSAREDRTFIPDGYTETILEIFQTTSNHQFNRAFKTIKDDALAESDRTSKLPVYPSVSALCDQASNMYSRLCKKKDGWVKSTKKKASGFAGQANVGQGRPQGPPPKCWNCGSPDHMVPKCDKPKDQKRITKAR